MAWKSLRHFFFEMGLPMVRKKGCNCLFCNFKCPECGNQNISVDYGMVFHCDNTKKNHLSFEHKIDVVEVECKKCGKELSYDTIEGDEELKPLLDALWRHLCGSIDIKIDHNHDITTKHHELHGVARGRGRKRKTCNQGKNLEN